MRIENYQFPKSSFLSVDKDMMIISEWMLKNNRLKKLLHYTTRDAMKKNNLTEDESYALFNKNIKMVPKLYIDGSVLNYIIIRFNNFSPNANNPEFRDNIISFDIVCHFNQWQLEDFQLRPYRIAAEIDSMFNNKHLTGIGTLQFLGANQIIINNEFAGLHLMYSAIHGGEDKVGMPNPANNAQFERDFDKLFNN